MTDLPHPLGDALLGEGVKQMQEISREEILRQIFGDIGELADDFTCAVESKVLLHGRMYITNRFICFYSNLFGLEKKIRIPYSHIRSITKENTAMVIPNAIAISTDKKDYTFRSFWDREDCYRILTAFLSKFRGISTEIPTPSRLRIRNSTSSAPTNLTAVPETPAGEDTDSSVTPAVTSSTGLDDVTISARHQSMPLPKRRTLPGVVSGNNSLGNGSNGRGPSPRPGDDNMDAEFETDPDTLMTVDKQADNIDQAAAFEAEITKCTQKLPVVTRETLSVGVQEFADLVIEEGAPYSFKWYHESVKDNSLVVSPWSEMPGGLGFGREIKFFKPVNLPGLASTRGVKLQRFMKFGELGLILCSSTRLEDVPCADSFSVEDTIVIRKVDANTVTIDISFCVLFLKSTMMKYIIERSTNGEMAKWLEVFYKHLKKITDLKREGKLTYPGESTVSPTASATIETAAPEPVTPTVAESSAPVTVAPPAPQKTGGGMVEGFMAMLSFREESMGDQIKFVLCLLLALYLVVNYVRWQMIAYKLEFLEGQLRNLESIAQQLLAHQQALQGANSVPVTNAIAATLNAVT